MASLEISAYGKGCGPVLVAEDGVSNSVVYSSGSSV